MYDPDPGEKVPDPDADCINIIVINRNDPDPDLMKKVLDPDPQYCN